MAFGVKSKTPFTFAVSSESEMEDVPNDSTRTLTGFATPITYDNWISHILAVQSHSYKAFLHHK